MMIDSVPDTSNTVPHFSVPITRFPMIAFAALKLREAEITDRTDKARLKNLF